MRKFTVMVWLVFLLGGIGALFWYNEWKYSLPTPVPANYKTVDKGRIIHLNGDWKAYGKKPLFLHFFNPRCPCSRFNTTNFKSLAKEYGSRINFVVVVMADEPYTVKEIQSKFDLNIPVIFDASVAAACGVYSTPQAVLLDKSHQLFFRGNYNSSRYCTDEKTNYAKQAIEGLLHSNNQLVFNRLALNAYGCSLPGCKL